MIDIVRILNIAPPFVLFYVAPAFVAGDEPVYVVPAASTAIVVYAAPTLSKVPAQPMSPAVLYAAPTAFDVPAPSTAFTLVQE